MITDQNIIGHWSVVEQQKRNNGEWIHEYDFEPGEWKMCFFLNGRMSEDFRPVGCLHEFRAGNWAFDPVPGIILFKFDMVPDHFDDSMMVFDPAPDGPWLYFIEEGSDFCPDRDTIVARHANERHRLLYL